MCTTRRPIARTVREIRGPRLAPTQTIESDLGDRDSAHAGTSSNVYEVAVSYMRMCFLAIFTVESQRVV